MEKPTRITGIKRHSRDFSCGPVVRLCTFNAGALVGELSHMQQLRVCMLQRRLKIPCATTKTWCSQINKINVMKK